MSVLLSVSIRLYQLPLSLQRSFLQVHTQLIKEVWVFSNRSGKTNNKDLNILA